MDCNRACVCLLTRMSEIVTAGQRLKIFHAETYWPTLTTNQKLSHLTYLNQLNVTARWCLIFILMQQQFIRFKAQVRK